MAAISLEIEFRQLVCEFLCSTCARITAHAWFHIPVCVAWGNCGLQAV
jgi:hypothetical protein